MTGMKVYVNKDKRIRLKFVYRTVVTIAKHEILMFHFNLQVHFVL